MNDPIIALKKIDSLLVLWSKNLELSPSYFAACKSILTDLFSKHEDEQLSGYTGEKLANLNWHINAMFGADIDNGKSFSDHLSFALGECDSLRSVHCFGALKSQ